MELLTKQNEAVCSNHNQLQSQCYVNKVSYNPWLYQFSEQFSGFPHLKMGLKQNWSAYNKDLIFLLFVKAGFYIWVDRSWLTKTILFLI